MEIEWHVARARLRELVREQPDISHQAAAQAMGYSKAWVRKWRKRIASSPEDETILHGLSRRPKHSPTRISAAAEEYVVELRTKLADVYHRTVGARTIFAHLCLVKELIPPWPHSTATIWRILRRRQYIQAPPVQAHQPLERATPGQHWELDYCTLSPRSEDAPDKRQNALEALDVVDRGTSAVIHSQAATDYDAESTLSSLAKILAVYGVPLSITIDRDPRLVGSNNADQFPSPLLRFLWCIGCEPIVLPPQRPDLKPYVERFQRTLKEECITHHCLANAQAANEVITPYIIGITRNVPIRVRQTTYKPQPNACHLLPHAYPCPRPLTLMLG
jgi:hypothetical protein